MHRVRIILNTYTIQKRPLAKRALLLKENRKQDKKLNQQNEWAISQAHQRIFSY